MRRILLSSSLLPLRYPYHNSCLSFGVVLTTVLCTPIILVPPCVSPFALLSNSLLSVLHYSFTALGIIACTPDLRIIVRVLHNYGLESLAIFSSFQVLPPSFQEYLSPVSASTHIKQQIDYFVCFSLHAAEAYRWERSYFFHHVFHWSCYSSVITSSCEIFLCWRSELINCDFWISFNHRVF